MERVSNISLFLRVLHSHDEGLTMWEWPCGNDHTGHSLNHSPPLTLSLIDWIEWVMSTLVLFVSRHRRGGIRLPAVSAPGEALRTHQLLSHHQPCGLLRKTGHAAEHSLSEFLGKLKPLCLGVVAMAVLFNDMRSPIGLNRATVNYASRFLAIAWNIFLFF